MKKSKDETKEINIETGNTEILKIKLLNDISIKLGSILEEMRKNG